MTLSHTPVAASVFAASASAQWVEYDLYTNKSVPKGAVCLIIIRNNNQGATRNGGVREKGSSIDRKMPYGIHESEGGGYSTAEMLVQTDATDGKIEVYAQDNTDVDFVLIGYLEGCSFTETFDFLGATPHVWTDLDLSSYGVPANAVVQLLLSVRSSSSWHYVGIRENGSSVIRTIALDEAEGAIIGSSTLSMLAKADGSSIIEWRGGTSMVNDFHYLLGWFSSNIDFTEDRTQVTFSSSKIDGVWESRVVSEAPASAIISMLLIHEDSGSETYCGVREEGSSQNRYILEHEQEGGGFGGFMAFVNLDASKQLEIYCGDSSESLFYYMGCLSEIVSASGFKQLIFTSEPPTGGAFNKLAYDSEPPTGGAWNKLKVEV